MEEEATTMNQESNIQLQRKAGNRLNKRVLYHNTKFNGRKLLKGDYRFKSSYLPKFPKRIIANLRSEKQQSREP